MPTLVVFAHRSARRVLTLGTLLSLSLSLAAAQSIPTGATRGPASGTTTSASTHSIPVPAATAVRRSGPIVLDAKLDEEAWKSATPITDFVQVDPNEGQPISEKTEFRFLFDDGALYIGAKLWDSEGRKGVHTTLVRRDQGFNSDYIEIVIDGFHDHLGRAFFDLNPSGSRQDQLGIGTSCCDSGWDPIWETATKVDDDGWTAEIRIPLNQLRFPNEKVQTWGLQVRRFIHRKNEYAQWATWKKNESGGPQRFGHLEGLELPGASKHLEILPYVVGRTKNVAFAPGDPYNDGSVQSMRAGLDLKYLLSSNLTLDATINPDFGQVEVDPAVINLTAFETSFPEKRPFFIANSGVFGFGSLNCYFCSNASSLSAFYSRRIGRAPTGADLAYSGGGYADVPDAATILGAGKITGRTSNGYTVGVLDAVTGKSMAPVMLANGTRTSQEVEPLTNYFVGRLKKDFMRGNLVVGGIVTSTIRNMDSTFAPRLNSHSEFYGSDFRYSWKNNMYTLMGQLALTNIEGDPRDIAARQRSSARYFQRPGRTQGSNTFLTNRYDTTLTTMRGLGGYTHIGKESGDWLWDGGINFRTPGFENNDLGFITRSDYLWGNATVFRQWTKPSSWYRWAGVMLGGQDQYNFSGDHTDRQVHFWLNETTPQFWSINTFYIWHPALDDDRLLRGGPTVQKPGTNFWEMDIGSDSRKMVSFNGGYGYSTNTRGGWGSNTYLSARYQPSTRVTVNFGPSWNDSRSLLQYVTAVNDPTNTLFAGKRYVLSALKQKSLALDTRLSVTFTPTMTVELYAQPLIGSGHYDEFKEFDRPHGGEFSIYGRDKGTISAQTSAGLPTRYTVDPDGTGPAQPFSFNNPDFNFRSLRGSALFRWEYLPGSTLYVAWTHSRSDNQPFGDFDFTRDREGLFATRPDNILLVKASWWLAR